MPVLLNKPLQALIRYTTGSSQENTAMYTWQHLISKYTYPCCSYTSLRHVGLEGIYWRRSHCYQEMPVYQPLQELTINSQTRSG